MSLEACQQRRGTCWLVLQEAYRKWRAPQPRDVKEASRLIQELPPNPDGHTWKASRILPSQEGETQPHQVGPEPHPPLLNSSDQPFTLSGSGIDRRQGPPRQAGHRALSLRPRQALCPSVSPRSAPGSEIHSQDWEDMCHRFQNARAALPSAHPHFVNLGHKDQRG